MSSSGRSEAPAVPPVVLLVGAEATLRDAALEEIRTRVLGGAARDFNEDRYDLASPGTDPAKIAVAARTLPLMAPRRLVIVRGLADRRAARFIEGPLLDYLEDPAPTSCVVLVAERVDRRLRWVKRIGAIGAVRDCSAPRRAAELRSWIEARVRREGKEPGKGSAEALLELVGPDLDRLGFEIEKVCLYVGEAGTVSADDVIGVTGALRPLALYELTDAIGARRLSEALRVLARLLDQGEPPLTVLGALANQFRRLIRAHACTPLEARELERRLALHPFAARKLAEQARRFDPKRLRACLDAIRRTDEALKGATPLAPSLALEQLVVAVCA